MANYSEKEYDKELDKTNEIQTHTLQITMVSRNIAELERVAYTIYDLAKEKSMGCKGPSSFKNKKFKITTRKSPCGNGSNTWDRYTMKVGKKQIKVTGTSDGFKSIMEVVNSPEVSIQVEVKE